ncbi:uncharacterized protein K02A2.6-like, partial [Notechis scutatus]|uniref:Uncharacterized protein K02A2.6-like n=1 Tax=Notechis scutatus TaxID=8663 RepID=A0A6J1UV91_9SAUR
MAKGDIALTDVLADATAAEATQKSAARMRRPEAGDRNATKTHSEQETRPSPPAAPILEWETPRGPWSRIHIDFAGPTKGHTFLITVDAYSNWLEVSNMRTTTTEAVTKELSKLFATHGLPDVIVSDNGPQFTSLEFEKFLAERGIRHALTALAHPAANGRAERMVQFTKKTIQKIENGEIQEKINKMLFIQHITPNTTTNKSPAELLMGR